MLSLLLGPGAAALRYMWSTKETDIFLAGVSHEGG